MILFYHNFYRRCEKNSICFNASTYLFHFIMDMLGLASIFSANIKEIRSIINMLRYLDSRELRILTEK